MQRPGAAKQQDPKKSVMKSPLITDMDHMYFTEIFHLESSIHEGHKDLRIDYDAMLRIFHLVNYEAPPRLLREF